jgi:hypothetical protein
MPPALDQTAARIALLAAWIEPRLTLEQRTRLEAQTKRIKDAPSGPALAMAIGLAPRKLGKADLALSQAEIETGTTLRPGLDAAGWSVDQAARMLFMLVSFDGGEAAFAGLLDRLLANSEVGEQIALLKGLPLYPCPSLLMSRAAEGVRSAMQPVFEAVAHANPYPREQFSEKQWNQMVVKALFIGSRLAPIQGLDARRNPDLAKMLIDYAHERWAAGRSVSPELWRCVGPYASAADIEDLGKVLREGSGAERKAAALALAEAGLPTANTALMTAPSLAASVRSGEITWHDVA